VWVEQSLLVSVLIVSVIARSHIQLKIKQSKKTDCTTMVLFKPV
jgi:hypothetical protein